MSLAKKIVLRSLGVIVVLFISGIVFLHFYLSDERLRSLAEPVLEDQLGRDVTLGGIQVRLLRALPNASVGIDELIIHTPSRDGVSQPDLASVERLWVDVPLMPLLRSSVEVKSIEIDTPQILVEVYDDLSTNLIEVTANEEEGGVEPVESDATETPLAISLDNVRITNGQIGYVHADGTLLTLSNLDVNLAAKIAKTVAVKGEVEVDEVFFETGGVTYADQWALAIDVDTEVNLDSTWMRIQTGQIQIEDLLMDISGNVSSWDTDKMGVDVRFSAPEASVQGFWSLLPATIKKDMEGLESSGTFSVDGSLVGEVTEGSLPAFNATLAIREGMVKYPSVPSAIRGLVLDARVTNEVLNVQRFQAEAEGASLSLAATVRDFANPVLQADIDLNADLAALETYYPLGDSTSLTGSIDVDARLDGDVADASNMQASGLIALDNIAYRSPDLEQPIEGLKGRIALDNDAMQFQNLQLTSGESDIQFEGSLVGYRAFMADSTAGPVEEPLFTGTLTSDYLNVTEQLSEDTTSSFVGPLELPPIRMDVNMQVGELVYNGISLKETSGAMKMEDGAVRIEDVQANFFSGLLKAGGVFNVQNPMKPAFSGQLEVAQIPVQEFFASFSDMDAIVRIGEYLDGLFNTNLSIGVSMDKDLIPSYESILAQGGFGAQQGTFGTMPLQEALSGYTGLSALKELSVRDWAHQFNISGEKLHIQNLTFDAGEYAFTVDGSQDFDGTLDYRITVELPESASNALTNAPIGGALRPVTSSINVALTDPGTNRITLDLAATGSFEKPSISLNSEMMQARLRTRASALAESAREEAQARLDSLENAAKQRAEEELAEQRKKLEEEANSLVEGLADSAGVTTDIDSLKEKGTEEVKKRLNNLLNRRKKKN